MKTTALVLLCACASLQAQEVRLEYADPTGTGIAFLGPDEIVIDVVLDFPGSAEPVAGGMIDIDIDPPGLAAPASIEPQLPPCPSAGPCVGPVLVFGDLIQMGFELPGGFNGGELVLATLHFDAIAIGAVAFTATENPGNPFFEPGGLPYTLPIAFGGTMVEIVEAEAGVSGSLPETFDNTVGVPTNWSTFFNPPLPRGPETLWRSSAETGVCDFGNVTSGDGNASCLQNASPTRGAGITAGSFLCTDAPLDTSEAVLPVLGLLANFQPGIGGATFRVISGSTPPPDVATYTTRFETTAPIGQFQMLPGQMLTIPLPSQVPLYICIVVDGDYAYAEVDECISCAVSYGEVPDIDVDGISDNVDNCDDTFNPDQRDTNRDGIGNACDADITNDCVVNSLDVQAIKAAFFSQQGQPGYNPDADFDGDGVINFGDLGLVKLQYFGPPGPSGLLNDCNVEQRAQRLRDCGIPD